MTSNDIPYAAMRDLITYRGVAHNLALDWIGGLISPYDIRLAAVKQGVDPHAARQVCDLLAEQRQATLNAIKAVQAAMGAEWSQLKKLDGLIEDATRARR
jgi:hypothetical protein